MPPTTPKTTDNKDTKAQDKKKGKKKEEEQQESPEDIAKREELALLVLRIQDREAGVAKLALETLKKEIVSATASMTTVPKPLKFLKPHYPALKGFIDTLPLSENKILLADILSVMAMTMATPNSRESLKFKLLNDVPEIGTWGHEYVRHLATEIAAEFNQRKEEEKPVDDLNRLVDAIIPFDMAHNAEPEACDLLMEVDQLSKIIPHVDENNYSRVCLYLSSAANYLPEPEDTQMLEIVLKIYRKVHQLPDALRVALRLNNADLVKEVYESCEDRAVKKQLAFLLARQCHFSIVDDDAELNDIISNTRLSENFLNLARDLDIMEAKTPEDVYKSNSDNRGYTTTVDSARANLASTFVNAFINAGFGQDKLMTLSTEEGNKWLYKNKEHGMMSAAASLGMILLWDVDGGLSKIDKFLYATEDYIKAGALLAVGIVNSGVRNDCDPALALLSDYLNHSNNQMRVGSILGLGLAYVGSAREDLKELVTPIVEDSSASMEVASIAGLVLGMIYVGTGNADVAQTIMMALMERDEASLNVSHSRFLCLGLGLVYLGKQEQADVTLATLKTIQHPIGKYASVTVDTCAYAGTGNVLKVQKLLDMCGDHLEDKNGFQAAAIIGISLIAMGEEVGTEMAFRTFGHLLQYGEPVIRRAIPIALGFLSISNPRITVMDLLSKLSHDSDEEVQYGAILGLGLIAAGTNNSRVANLLRGLASYFQKEPNQLFLVRIAQGLVFLGKGTHSLAPYHSDRNILSPVALSGLLVLVHACLDFKNIILSKSHYLLYSIVTALHPRLLMTFDENLQPLPVSVRVGQAVDTIGQAGKPKTITGFQTHTTPVLLSYTDRAELATDDYLSLTSMLEGFVILKPNPNATPKIDEEKEKEKKKK